VRRPQSYSSISLYKKCPKSWEWNYVLGNRKPPGPAADRGTELHLKLEEFFLGKTQYPAYDKTLRPWQRFMENLTRYNPVPECLYAVDKHWGPVDYEDPDAWARGKGDLTYTLESTRHILDWKSGRVYPNHPEQGRMYVALDQEEPEIYKTEFVYLDIPLHIDSRYVTTEDKRLDRVKLDHQIIAMNTDEEYKATPSQEACQWCPLSWRRGGDCRSAP